MSKVISAAELKQHNTGRELWLAIHDNVYDVTKFLEEVIHLLFSLTRPNSVVEIDF